MAAKNLTPDYSNQVLSDLSAKLSDLEERQNVMRDRLLLIGQNLIETKDKMNTDMIEVKKNMDIMKRNMEKMLSFIEDASEEFPKFARRSDLEILAKQAKMFQPLEFIRKKDLKKLKA